MKILAIETSCDETAVAVLECEGDLTEPRCSVLAHELYSQAAQHQKYGGVYPNLAKRLHSKNLVPLLTETLREADMLHPQKSQKAKQNYSTILQNCGIVLEREPELFEQFKKFIPTVEKPGIDIIAVTQGPGLEPALWVGLNFAKALSLFWDIPLIPVNHMEGHIASVLYKDNTPVAFPALALLISGGHTQLVLVKNWGEYKLLGETRDDAVGEAFDKVGRILGLPYPGGPEISRLALKFQSRFRIQDSQFKLPRPMIDSPDYDFSFSGLKTAVLYKTKELKKLTQKQKEALALEFENAVTDVLVTKTRRALKEYHPKTLIVAGGVIANTHLRRSFEELVESFPDTTLHIPHPNVTGDNAIMIGIAGYLNTLLKKGKADVQKTSDVRASGTLSLNS